MSDAPCDLCGLPKAACETIEHQRRAIEALTRATAFLPPAVVEGAKLVAAAQDHVRAADEAYRRLLTALGRPEHPNPGGC
jgi:hypothetical protein